MEMSLFTERNNIGIVELSIVDLEQVVIISFVMDSSEPKLKENAGEEYSVSFTECPKKLKFNLF
ncbi:hypothetical protein DVH24_029366 [Malus domestica]|uniref:Uncharacterized protein n=1 Tax=Malus domestica TaxID=3750 RepID=A0A498HYJ3_MALDO|nr:hypothetical protein DVH24_029366 [Malus domestica]